MSTPNVVPRADAEGNIGTSSKRWVDVYLTGDISDGTDATSAAEIKDAYDHTALTNNPHTVTAVQAGADPTGTAASEVAAHEVTYDHSLIIAADPAGTAAAAIVTHNAAYDHTKIANAEQIQSRAVSAVAPSDGQALVWSDSNNQWEPGAEGTCLTSVTTDTTIDGTGVSGDPIYVVDDGHNHTLSTVTDAGTAAALDYPAAGNAGATEVVIGTDTRLTNSRTPSTHATSHEAGGSDQVGHDDLSGFVADEHIAHSSVTITAGDGLSGGGTIAATRTLSVDMTYFPQAFILDVGDETTEITTGTDKKTFRMPYLFHLTDVRASLTTAAAFTSSSSSSSSVQAFTVDINKNGTTILSTKLTIDAGETTSTTAAIPVVISVSDIQDDDEVTIDVDDALQSATGLKVTLIGTREGA